MKLIKQNLRLYVFVVSFAVVSAVFGVLYGIYESRYTNSAIGNEAAAVYGLTGELYVMESNIKLALRSEMPEDLDRIIIKYRKTMLSAENNISRLAMGYQNQSLSLLRYLFSEIDKSLAEKYMVMGSGGDCSRVNNRLKTHRKTLNDLYNYFLTAERYIRAEEDSGLKEYNGIISLMEEKEGVVLSSLVNTTGILEAAAEMAASDKKYFILSDAKKIEIKEAEKIAVEIFELETKISLAGKMDSGIAGLYMGENNLPEVYRFYCENAYADITSAGGYIREVQFERSLDPESVILSREELIVAADNYLDKFRYKNFRLYDIQIANGIFNAEYVYVQTGENDVMCLNDKIKIGLTMDRGKLVYFDADDYLRNRREREISDTIITSDEALISASSLVNSEKITDIYLAIAGEEEEKPYYFFTDGIELIAIDAENGKIRG